METGVELISQERHRQIHEEGWHPEHDNEHIEGELALAATAYAKESLYADKITEWRPRVPENFPINWNPAGRFPPSRIRTLVKAGALIAAEIDRLQRHKAV